MSNSQPSLGLKVIFSIVEAVKWIAYCPIWMWAALNWIFAFDLDETSPGEKDAISTCVSLSTFLTVLTGLIGTGLTGYVKEELGESLDFALLMIYGALTAFSIAGVIIILRTRDDSGKRIYNQPTVRFGRWSITLQLTLYAMLMVTYAFGLIPQRETEPYLADSIPCELLKGSDYVLDIAGSHSRPDERIMSIWLKWIHAGISRDGNSFIILRQREPFQEDFKTIHAALTHRNGAPVTSIVERAGFIVREHDANGLYRPIYRQIFFAPTLDDVSNDLVISTPEVGERIIILLSIAKEGDAENISVKVSHPVTQVWQRRKK